MAALDSELIKLRKAYANEMRKTVIDRAAAEEARQNIIDFIRDNVSKGELSESALQGVMREFNMNPGKIGLKYANMIPLGKDASGKEIYLSVAGKTYDSDTIRKIGEEMKRRGHEASLVGDGAELVTPGDMVEAYNSSYAAEHEKSSRAVLSSKTRRSRLTSIALVGGALAIAAVSGGLAIPALVGVGGAIAGLGTSAAAVVTGLGVTGVSTVVAAGAAGGWVTNEVLTSREPDTLNLKYNIAHDKHVKRMSKLEEKLDKARHAKYTSQAKIERLEKALGKELERGLAVDQKFAAKFNKRYARLEKGGALADWLDAHGISRFANAHEAALANFGALREVANARVASNMVEAVRLNDTYHLNLQQGKTFKQIMNRTEKVGFFNKSVNRTVAEYDEIHAKVIEDVMTKNKDAYAKLGSWQEIKDQLIKDCGFDEIKGIPPRTEAKMLIDILGSDGSSDALKNEAKQTLFEEGVLRNAIDELKGGEDGKNKSYDEKLARFMKENKDLIVGIEPTKPAKSFKDAYGYDIPIEPEAVTLKDPGKFTETAPVVPDPVKKPGKEPAIIAEPGAEPIYSDPTEPKKDDFADEAEWSRAMTEFTLDRAGGFKNAKARYAQEHKDWEDATKAYEDSQKAHDDWEDAMEAYKSNQLDIKEAQAKLKDYEARLEQHKISKAEYDAAVKDYTTKKAKFDKDMEAMEAAHPDWKDKVAEYDAQVAEYDVWKGKDDQYSKDMKDIEKLEPAKKEDVELSEEEKAEIIAKHEEAAKKAPSGPAPTV